jgi:hypothetical protein
MISAREIWEVSILKKTRMTFGKWSFNRYEDYKAKDRVHHNFLGSLNLDRSAL